MYVVAGATGKVGSATAQALLKAGASVKVLVRRQEDGELWQKRGAHVAVVGLDQRQALAHALEGCSGFFALLPFNLTVDDLDEYADRLIASIAGAVADVKVPHVVMLSSGGADLPEGTGPITGLHRLEQALLATGTTLTALRSGHFQEKFLDAVDLARENGIFPVFAASADVPLLMVATRDIGEAVAEALMAPPRESQTVDIIGVEYTERQVAAVLGKALGKELEVVTVPQEAWVDSLMDAGFQRHIAESLAELYRADETGKLAPRAERRITVSTPLEDSIKRALGSRA